MEHRISQNKHYPRGGKEMNGRWAEGFFFSYLHWNSISSSAPNDAESSIFRKSYGGFHQQKPSTACLSSSPQQFQKCCNLRLTLIIKGRFTVSSLIQADWPNQIHWAAAVTNSKWTLRHPDSAKAPVLILSFNFQVMLFPSIRKKRAWCMVS